MIFKETKMPKVPSNSILYGISGALGKQIVFRTRKQRTFVSAMPVFTLPPTEKQIRQRERFKQASAFAEMVKSKPELLEWYRQQGNNAGALNAVIIRDFLRPPVIHHLQPELQSGFLQIEVTDDTAVTKVVVDISDMDGNVMESGNAVQKDVRRWSFYSEILQNIQKTVKISVSAFDQAQNLTQKEMDITP